MSPATTTTNTAPCSTAPPTTFSSPELSLDLSSLKQSYDDRGYVVIRSFLPATSLETLRKASASVTDRTRRGEWPHRRIVGKRFPPYEPYAGAVEGQPDVWGVQHLLHPDILGEEEQRDQPSKQLKGTSSSPSPFLAFYSDPRLLELSSALLGCPSPSSLQLELFNLLIEPKTHYFALPWHRDDVRSDVAEEEERQRLAAPTCGVQWNVALWDDECLFVVPGSQKRVRSQEERKANMASPPSATPVSEAESEGKERDGSWDVDPPTTMRVKLKAGDAVFYSLRILHRASYVPTAPRATLHGCYGALPTRAVAKAAIDDDDQQQQSQQRAEEQRVVLMERARNILQHDVSWMREPSFGASLPESLRPMWKNLLEMDRQARQGSQEVGYSLEG